MNLEKKLRRAENGAMRDENSVGRGRQEDVREVKSGFDDEREEEMRSNDGPGESHRISSSSWMEQSVSGNFRNI